MSERFDFTGDELAPAYRAAVDAIEAGDLVVLPTDTVYGIAADAFKAEAVQRLLDAKGTGRHVPPPVLISVVESLDALATDVGEAGRKLCEEFWPGPLTVICHAQSSLMWDLGDTQGTVSLRVPDHENTRELLSRTGPLAVSSANKSGAAAALDVYDAEEQLGEAVAVYLDGGEAAGGAASTIVDITGDIPRVVRVGALSIDQLRAVVPEVTTDPDTLPEPASTDNNPADDKPADDKPAEESPVEDKPSEDKPVEETASEENPVEETASEENPVQDKPADDKLVEPEPADASAVQDDPAEEKPAEDELVEPEAAEDKAAEGGAVGVVGEPTGSPAGASKEDGDKSDPDVRPAD